MKIGVIIVAGGSGTRLKAKVPKAFVFLKGKPLITRSLTVFQRCAVVKSIVVVGHKDHLGRLASLKKKFTEISVVVPGGVTRADSVKYGRAALSNDTDIVLVHDAARPLVNAPVLGRLLAALKKHKAVIAAVPVKATIKQVNAKTLLVDNTLRRDLLWDVQTPQGFHRNVLVKAHQLKFKGEATDDAMLVERLGVPVKVVMGDHRNIKITTPEDLKIAEGLI